MASRMAHASVAAEYRADQFFAVLGTAARDSCMRPCNNTYTVKGRS